MAKRGRKPKEKATTGYFHEEQENAVLEYLKATDAETKNKIYLKTLKPALEKMVESIIRRYHLYMPNEDFGNTSAETLSFLMTKVEKYNPDKHKKAYSYFGTICKNHLIGEIDKYNTTLRRNPSYDPVIEEYTNNIKYSEQASKSAEIARETMNLLIEKLGKMTEQPEKYDLKENEIKLGKALKTLFENWEYVLSTDTSSKLNKNAILLFLRENTGMDTKGIRDNLKKFKKEFLLIKNFVIE